jgi:hypothetical protein
MIVMDGRVDVTGGTNHGLTTGVALSRDFIVLYSINIYTDIYVHVCACVCAIRYIWRVIFDIFACRRVGYIFA